MNRIMVGMDLHSNNVVIALVDETGKRIGHKRCENTLREIFDYLAPYKTRIASIAIESTFNWYWLVDGLQDEGYTVFLANPSAIPIYSGLKHANDKTDGYWLAEMLRLDILPKGYIYPRHQRADRDIIRRRHRMVQSRTGFILSAKGQYHRTCGSALPLQKLNKMSPKEAAKLYAHPSDGLIASIHKELIEKIDKSIKVIESRVNMDVPTQKIYSQVRKLPGVGEVLGRTIAMEVGDIARFASPENFASYCRAVAANRESNAKIKGQNNSKCGNKYLAWAFVEAANHACQNDEQCRSWFTRKKSKTCSVLATKALACKLAKAAWHLIKTGGEYAPERMFPGCAPLKFKAQRLASGRVGQQEPSP